MNTVPVAEDQRANWARFADDVRNDAMRIQTAVLCGRKQEAAEKLQQFHLTGAAALCALRDAGAPMPEEIEPAPAVPIDLLNTRATRRFVAALEAAIEAAREVDRERHPEADDDVTGFGLVELLVKWREEVYGPDGRGEGVNR